MTESPKPRWIVLDFMNTYKWPLGLLGGALTAVGTFLWWLATGGAVAFLSSVAALSDPNAADVLLNAASNQEILHAQVEDVSEDVAEVKAAVDELSLALHRLLAQNAPVAEWLPLESQKLTDQAGGAFPGGIATIYLRGRLVGGAEGCRVESSQPFLLLDDGQEFPVSYAPGTELPRLGEEFQTFPLFINIPSFTPPGRVGVVTVNVFASCPFAPPGETVDRKTIRVSVLIHEPPATE